MNRYQASLFLAVLFMASPAQAVSLPLKNSEHEIYHTIGWREDENRRSVFYLPKSVEVAQRGGLCHENALHAWEGLSFNNPSSPTPTHPRSGGRPYKWGCARQSNPKSTLCYAYSKYAEQDKKEKESFDLQGGVYAPREMGNSDQDSGEIGRTSLRIGVRSGKTLRSVSEKTFQKVCKDKQCVTDLTNYNSIDFSKYGQEAIVYGYSSTPDQTDNSPFITANGTRVYDGIVANNCLPFSSKVWIAGRVYIVTDRMNARYGCHVFDRWFPSRAEAIAFGKKKMIVTILP